MALQRFAALAAFVRGVGAKLAAVSDRALPYEFVVLNNSVLRGGPDYSTARFTI